MVVQKRPDESLCVQDIPGMCCIAFVFMCYQFYSLFQPGDTGELESAQQVSSHYLVELSAVMASGQDEIGSNMRSFAEQLKPYPQY